MNRPTRDATAGRPAGWEAPGAALVRSAAQETVPALRDLGRVHIMGIAGSGTSALARLLIERGVLVSGCEARESPAAQAMRDLGATVHIGHSPDHLADVDTFIYTTAINPKHPEFAAARARPGLSVLRRAAALAAVFDNRRRVAIAGTHGKTTTTALLTVGAQAAGADPSYAVGAPLAGGVNAHVGRGELALIEADESDGSFLLSWPEVALITNVEADHLENHGDLAGVLAAFELFTDRIAAGGTLVVCADDAGARRIAQHARAGDRVRVLTYGEGADADVRVSAIDSDADRVRFTADGDLTGRRDVVVRSLVGRHMALNAAGALSVAAVLGLDLDAVAGSWPTFRGVRRRFEHQGDAAGVRVYDDYAHHPTEIEAQLRAARAAAGAGRVVAVFQPGTYSRTQTFAAEFGSALGLADVAVVLDIFPAREEPLPGVSGVLIAERVPASTQTVYEPDFTAAAARIASLARPGDLIVTMGIGDVWTLCAPILQALGAPR